MLDRDLAIGLLCYFLSAIGYARSAWTQGLQAFGQKAAVDGETVPGDVGGCGKAQKRDRRRDFFRFSDAIEWRSLLECTLAWTRRQEVC
jgi:hypothetical protein